MIRSRIWPYHMKLGEMLWSELPHDFDERFGHITFKLEGRLGTVISSVRGNVVADETPCGGLVGDRSGTGRGQVGGRSGAV